ncbi:MAG TPA: hypothetical protein VI942_04450, partial [Thermoanaerobaculia bacterium]|nr:hypothetical protein [Thermoanaerobaculia bacterium]
AVASVAAIVALGGAPWAPADLVVSPKLWGWSAIGLLAGRGVGLLPYYLPATLLFATAGRDEGRRFVVPATLAAILVQLALAPFDFVESGGGFGNGWFLPLYAVLLAAASHDEGPRWTLAIGAAGAPFLLAPVWLASAGLLAPAAAVDRLVSPAVALLPEPTTLRAAPGAADLVRPGLVARGIEPAIFAGRGRLRLFARRGRLFVVADRALSSLRLELGADAPVAIEVRGGKLGNTTIRPDGELAVDVALDPRRARRHPVWWSREDAWIHALEVRLPAAPAAPIALDVPFGRGVVPAVNERR